MRTACSLSVLLILTMSVVQASAQPVTLVTLGDSLTEGDGDDGMGGGYPARLIGMLQADHPGSVLTNVGVSGHTSDDLINIQLDPAVAALNGAPPGNRRLALVWIGSNDLFGLYNYVCDVEYNNNFDGCEEDTFGYFSENLGTILTALVATSADIYIALLDDQSRRPVMTDASLRTAYFDLITADDLPRMSEQVSLYNAEIATQAAAHGATTVDFFNTTIFEDWATLSDDGNHPNGAGYDTITAIWYQAISGGTPSTYRLTVSRGGSGSGTVTSNPSGISCGTDCTHDYGAGTQVTLTATPSSGSTFGGWSGGCSGSGSCTVTMSSNRSVRATFNGTAALDHAYVVPVVVHGPGDAGTNWRSGVVCVNATTSEARLDLSLQTSSGSWSQPATVQAGASEEWQDIVVDLFGVSASSSTAGALHIAADQPLLITSRTYNQGASGTFGQYLPALTDADALSGSDRGYLLNLKGIGFRSNVGFSNLGSGACTVRLMLYDSAGDAIGRAMNVTLPAGGWVQKNDVFSFTGAAAQDLAYAVVDIPSGVGSFWAYASVVDVVTGDATTIPVLRE